MSLDRKAIITPRPLGDSVEEQIVKERNREIEQLEADLRVFQELLEIIKPLLQEQGEQLEEAEENTTQSVVATTEAVKDQKSVSKRLRGKKIVRLLSGGGAVGGGLFGTAGFLINPPVGVISMIALSALGFGTGMFVGEKIGSEAG